MKTLKIIFASWIVTIYIVLGLSSCQNYNIDSQPAGAPKIDSDALEQYNIQANKSGNIVFNISANTPWKITVETDDDEQNWCIPSPGISSASGLISEISVAATSNEKKTPREAILTIKADGVEKPIVIKIVQAAQGNLSVYGAALSEIFDVNPSEPKKLFIRSNRAWQIVSTDTWVHFSQTEGEASDDVIVIDVSADPNDEMKKETTFSVSTSIESKDFVIKQQGAILEVAEEDMAILKSLSGTSKIGDVVEVNVTSTIDWKPTTSETWIKNIEKSGDKLIFTLDANPTFASRDGIIMLNPVGSSELSPVTLTVTQNTCLTLKTRKGESLTENISLINNQGYLAFPSAQDVRLVFGDYKYGKFTWEFEELKKGSDANTLMIELMGAGTINADVRYPNSNINIFNTAATAWQGGNVFRASGTFGWVASNAGDIASEGRDKLLTGTSIKKIELTLSKSNTEKIHFYLVIDGVVTLDKELNPVTEVWGNTEFVTINMYYNASKTDYSCILKSFTAENLSGY